MGGPGQKNVQTYSILHDRLELVGNEGMPSFFDTFGSMCWFPCGKSFPVRCMVKS